MNFTLHQLRIFREVVRLRSITKAAEKMHMTQPALSIQMKNFQGQFDIPLTEVIGKQLHITKFGKDIAELADNILSEAERLKYRTQEYNDLLAGELRISSASTGKYVIPYFLSGFTRSHPSVDLILDVSNKTRVLRNLKDNEIDIALVSVVPENLDVEEIVLLDNQLYLVGDSPDIDPEKPLIFREEGSATRQAMDAYFGRKGGRKSLELTSNEAVKQAVIAGLGYSILPLIGIRNELANKELHIIKAPGLPMTTKWRLIWLKGKKLSPLALKFLEYISENKSEIAERQFKWYLDYASK